MSAEIPPEPVTNQFNPTAWALPALTPEEEALLNSQFVTFPITQSNTISFPTAPIAPTLPPNTNTTQVATTGFVQNAITAFTSTVNTWLGIQIFSVGMTSNTINPTTTSGTLIIGNAAANTNVEVASSASRNVILHLGDGNNNTVNAGIHIGNGATSANNIRILDGAGSTGTIFLGSATSTTSLGCPLTPTYSYPVAVGKIGEIINYTGSTAGITFTANSPLQVMSLTGFTPGTWLMVASVGGGTTPIGVYMTIAISTTSADVTSANAVGIEYMTGGGFGMTSTLSCIIQSTSASTVYYVNAQRGSGGSTTITPAGWQALRFA